MKKIVLFLILISNALHAAYLEDVQILDAVIGPNNLEVKMQLKNAPLESYFFLDVTQNDPQAFKKMLHIFRKMTQGAQHKLNLNIPHFSPSENGRYYKSSGITFGAKPNREPNQAKKKKSTVKKNSKKIKAAN